MIEALSFTSDAPALFVGRDDAAISYRELGHQVDAVRDLLRRGSRPALAFQFLPNGVAAVSSYLACLAEKIPLGLSEPAAGVRSRIIDAYKPSLVFLPSGETPGMAGYEQVGELPHGAAVVWQCTGEGAYVHVAHPELALLLATSGSTGDAKFVRLSGANMLANACSIATYLGLAPGEIAIQSLPLHYSYGLSVLNSHLLAGATVALTSHSFIRPEFWRVVDGCRCTSFAGVPYMYETLHRLRINPAEHNSLRTMTQAGGHLRVDFVRYFHEAAMNRGARFFVMYGQTEATARIAYVPPERLSEKYGSIGIAIPNGRLWLEVVDGEPAQQQLFYSGPNVMMGYANGPADLARGDELGGILATGDLAECDGDGYFRLTGRMARIAKLFGKRINLAGVETEVEKGVLDANGRTRRRRPSAHSSRRS